MSKLEGDDCTMEMSEEAKAMMAAHRAVMAAKEEQALLDNFAMAALKRLAGTNLNLYLDTRRAWDYAESMVAERKRRMEAGQHG